MVQVLAARVCRRQGGAGCAQPPNSDLVLRLHRGQGALTGCGTSSLSLSSCTALPRCRYCAGDGLRGGHR